jgi:hypothetical protein
VLQAAMLTNTVADKNAELTVLAPTNSAFGKMSTAEIEALLNDKDKLVSVCFALGHIHIHDIRTKIAHAAMSGVAVLSKLMRLSVTCAASIVCLVIQICCDLHM